MLTDKTKKVSKRTSKDAITGIAGLTEEAVAALVTQGRHNTVSRTDKRLEAILQCSFNKMIDEEWRLVECDERFFRRIEDVILSTRDLRRMMEAMLVKQEIIAPLTNIVMKETEQSVKVEL